MRLVRRYLVLLTAATAFAANASAPSPSVSAGASSGSSKTSRPVAGSDDAQQRAFTRSVLAINAAFGPKLLALEQRGEDVKLGSMLSGVGLTTPAGIAAGRTAVAQMYQMLGERRETVRLYHQELHRLLTPELQTALGAKSVDQLQTKLAHAERMAGALDNARVHYVEAVESVLSWAEQQGDTIKLQDAQFTLTSNEQIEQYKTLFAKVQVAAADEGRAYDVMAPIYQQYLQEMERVGRPAVAR
jgi:hypothetical protein